MKNFKSGIYYGWVDIVVVIIGILASIAIPRFAVQEMMQ